MKSKIEKLVIYYDEILGKDRDVRILDMANKIDEIIDHLNSQDQEGENTVCEGCGKTITSRFMQSYTKGDGMHSYCLSCDPEKQDAPEEWRELFAEWGLWSLVEDISDDGDGHGDNLQLTKEGREAYRMIKGLLDEREREAEKNLLKRFYNATSKEEFRDVLDKLSKKK